MPETFRRRHPEIAWRGITGLRDVITHDYEGVDYARVWQVVEHDLPPLKKAIEAILPPLNVLEQELAGEAETQE